MALTAGFKKFIGLIVVAGAVGGGIVANNNGYFKSKDIVASTAIDKIDVPTSSTTGPTSQVSKVDLAPSTSGYTARVLTIPWNATMGMHFANGDVTTSSDSLMAKHGVKATLVLQDMYDQMLAEQIKFAQQVKAGVAQPTEGAAFVVIMGDGYPAYITGAQEALGKLGQQLEVVAALGYSRGEDKCMLPTEVKANPQKARGSLIGGVKGDGDINICLKWAADNGIPINPDGTTYDPEAMNFAYVDSFIKADDNLIAGFTEKRAVVKAGKKTGETRAVTQNGTATWTPGDVKVAKMKGGMVAVASTKEYMWQMPATLIGNKQWMAQNREYVENFIAAALEGGEQVRSNDAALTKGSQVSAKVYAQETPDFWKKYYKGVVETDKSGAAIHLGGSIANGLGDNAFLFGLNGNDNLYKRVYTVFGNLQSKLYPDLLPKVIDYNTVVNTTYLQSLLNKSKQTAAAVTPTFSQADQVTGTFATRSVSIEFETGKATFTPATMATLNDLLNQLSINGLAIQINGHTDNVGDQNSNIELSKKRAEAVKAWIANNAPSSFPIDRIRARGYGDTTPIADNSTAAGKTKNRRVEIQLLNTK